MKICKKCQAYLSNESKFCNVCGEPLDVVLDDKFCSFCGTKVRGNARTCPKCGYLFDKENDLYVKKQSETSSVTSIIIKIFMILSCVTKSVFILPLAWCVPMTVSAFKKIENNEKLSLSFKICTLIFVDLVSGIIMLSDENL